MAACQAQMKPLLRVTRARDSDEFDLREHLGQSVIGG